MDVRNKFNKGITLPTKNKKGETMFPVPTTMEEYEDGGTAEFLNTQQSAVGWGMTYDEQGLDINDIDLPTIPTHTEAFQAAAPSYCDSFNTRKRMAMVSPAGSQDSSSQHTNKKVVVELWQEEQDDGSKMVESAGITGQDVNEIDANGQQVQKPQLSTTTQLHNEQEMLIKMAAALGVDLTGPQGQQNLDTFLSTPITTVGSVLKLMTTFHTNVTQVELKSHAMSVEVMLDIFGDKIVSMHKELTWLGKEHRTTQKQRASTQVILSGWPNNCDPEERNGFIRWMCREAPGLAKLLFQWYKYDVQNDPTTITHILQVPPTTLSYGGRFGVPRYSPITILTFTNFDARQDFLKTFMGWQPSFEWSNGQRTDKKIRSAPASPDFQRQLEVPLRTIHKVLNTAPNTKGQQFVTLWKTLTVMQPQEKTFKDDDHKACFRLEYTVHKSTGDVVAEMHITHELAEMMKLKYDTQTQRLTDNQDANTLWQSCWQNQVTGREQEVTDATVDANKTVRTEGAYETGVHWSQEFTKYTNTAFPFKIKLIVYPQDMDIHYNYEEYDRKMKNVAKNTQDRKENTDTKGPEGKSEAGAWDTWTRSQQGLNSQSSTGASPTQGNAPTQPMQVDGGVEALRAQATAAEAVADALRADAMKAQAAACMQAAAEAEAPKVFNGAPVPKSAPTQPTASALLDPSTLSPTQPGLPTAPPGDWSKDGGKGKAGGKGGKNPADGLKNDANCGKR